MDSTWTLFVFSGGGTPGAAQVGMLQALAEAGIVADALVGTSVGALNAGFLAGYPPGEGIEQLRAAWLSLRRRDVFPLHAPTLLRALVGRSNHLFPSDALRGWIRQHLTYDTVEGATTPVKVIATDAETGDEVILDSGDAVQALLASAALPVAFAPVRWGERLLIDGGITSNSPLRVALDWPAPAGHQKAVYVLPTNLQREGLGTDAGVVRAGRRALEMLIAQQLDDDLDFFARARRDSDRYAETRVFVVPPCPDDHGRRDFALLSVYIESGYQSAKRWLEQRG
jgi:NTE family protein